jgi:hypothetical protein
MNRAVTVGQTLVPHQCNPGAGFRLVASATILTAPMHSNTAHEAARRWPAGNVVPAAACMGAGGIGLDGSSTATSERRTPSESESAQSEHTVIEVESRTSCRRL